MQSFKTVDSINKWLTAKQLENQIIGFVPTMGALHEGHLSLINFAKSQCDVVIASIFVNPTQFNSLDDLEKYPRSLENDVRLLIMSNCDGVFVPEVQTMYPDFPQGTNLLNLDFNGLDDVMEGVYRPGHFNGVANVVFRLFEIINPHKAFFGEKDYQQLAIIKTMVNSCQLPIEIIAVETVREANGLAMSSRNQRLTQQGKRNAGIIFETLNCAKELSQRLEPKEVLELCKKQFKNSSLELEYIEIVHPETLRPLSNQWVNGARCFIAAHCEGVRLIDNLELIP